MVLQSLSATSAVGGAQRTEGGAGRTQSSAAGRSAKHERPLCDFPTSLGAFNLFLRELHFVRLGVLLLLSVEFNFALDVTIFFPYGRHAHCCSVCSFSNQGLAATIRRGTCWESCASIASDTSKLGTRFSFSGMFLAVRVCFFVCRGGGIPCQTFARQMLRAPRADEPALVMRFVLQLLLKRGAQTWCHDDDAFVSIFFFF